MATAQLKTWIAAHRGDIDELSEDLDRSLADIAVGRTMLYRRRAAVAKVVDEFFTALGSGFGPYLDGRAPQAPFDVAAEIAKAEEAAALLSERREAIVPLLFERAIVARATGNPR